MALLSDTPGGIKDSDSLGDPYYPAIFLRDFRLLNGRQEAEATPQPFLRICCGSDDSNQNIPRG
jgi:hypothetical protein